MRISFFQNTIALFKLVLLLGSSSLVSYAFPSPQLFIHRRSSLLIHDMVRNIDLPECLIFYGYDTLVEGDGLDSLLQECQETNTAVVVIDLEQKKHNNNVLKYIPTFQPPPNPRDLYTTITSITIQPRPFGGSSGFGQKLPDPERPILPQRTVVIASTIDQTRAARYCGMRVLSLNEKDDLADAVIDDIDFWLDDIATPGSFWLNPPHPRDDHGNKIDVEQIIDMYESNSGTTSTIGKDNDTIINDNDDDRWKAILADIAPLE